MRRGAGLGSCKHTGVHKPREQCILRRGGWPPVLVQRSAPDYCRRSRQRRPRRAGRPCEGGGVDKGAMRNPLPVPMCFVGTTAASVGKSAHSGACAVRHDDVPALPRRAEPAARTYAGDVQRSAGMVAFGRGGRDAGNQMMCGQGQHRSDRTPLRDIDAPGHRRQEARQKHGLRDQKWPAHGRLIRWLLSCRPMPTDALW
eukprot:364649-Chlamydomonas_euryale.AAC.3